MSGRRRALVLVAGAGVAAGWGLVALGPAVPGPPAHADALVQWYDAVGPVAAVAGVARWVGVGLAVWVSVASILQLAASATALVSLQSIADVLSPRSLQRVGYGLAGLSLTAGLAAPAPGAGIPSVIASERVLQQGPGSEDPTPVGSGSATMHRVEPSATTQDSEPEPTEAGGSSATAGLPPPIVAPSTTAVPVLPTSTTSIPLPASTPSPATVGAAPAPAPPPVDHAPLPVASPAVPAALPGQPADAPAAVVDSRPSAAGDTVVVQPGDSLWSIAEEALVDLTGHADDRTISRYWRRVVDANRAALVDPGNPDLIFAGQVITLPAP